MKIEVSTDKDIVDAVRIGLMSNNGHCPCQLSQTKDTKCICKNFREQEELGPCQCGLYIKTEV